MPLLADLEWELEDYLSALRLHKRLILLSCVLWVGCAALLLMRQPNLYQATCRILIEAQPPQVVQFRELTPYAGTWLQGFLQTEFQIITSPPVLEKVVEELNLAAFPPFSETDDPARVLHGMLEVAMVRGTKLMDISATNPKPELAARIANAVADAYARLNIERRQELTATGIRWLKEEVDKMEGKMRTANLALQAFREEHGTVDFGEEHQNTTFQRLRDLSTAVTDSRKERIEAETKYRQKHPILQELQIKERELQQALSEQEERALELTRLSIQYNTLQREAKTSENIYNTLLNRLKELSVQEGVQTNNVQVVSYGKVPKGPYRPNRKRIHTVAALLGLLFGGVLAILREAMAKTLRTRTEFERLLEIPFLGYVPSIQMAKEHRGNESLLLLTEPQSTAAETLRAIRTTLEFILPAGQPCALLITSALPEEGKSLITLNLAVALQELGRKVLLIDADMRRPSIHRLLGLALGPGLSDYLQGQADAEELIQVSATARDLAVLPAGVTPPQPTDLLVSPRMRELLERFKTQYQYILMDSPPVLAVADTTALANLVNGIIYVVWSGRTHRDVALAGKTRLMDVGAHLLGGILNGLQQERSRGYTYYYYSRKYAKGSPGQPKVKT